MKFMQDSRFDQAVSLCEAVLSGEASKQVLDAAKTVLSCLPRELQRAACSVAVNRGKPTYNHGPHHYRVSIPCALANL